VRAGLGEMTQVDAREIENQTRVLRDFDAPILSRLE
jgi:hypothetical protein